jgi:ring-1,2-phenylacetyl-CoA epoxidase subunit PaaE
MRQKSPTAFKRCFSQCAVARSLPQKNAFSLPLWRIMSARRDDAGFDTAKNFALMELNLCLISSMKKLRLQVLQVVHETTNTATLFLKNTENDRLHYEAGQFLTLVFLRHGREIRRSYSFSSAPEIDDYLSITVKRKANGEISRYLLDQIHPGDILHSLPPAGLFTFDTKRAFSRQLFFIAAGSGITPIFSLLKKILGKDPRIKVILIYQSHDENSIIFNNQLNELATKHLHQFTWINLLSKPKKKPHISLRLTNFLLERMVRAHIQSKEDALFYLCGPTPYMRMAQFTLKVMGFADTQIKKENFSIVFIPRAPLGIDPGPKQINIQFQKKSYSITARYPDSILDAALKNNIELPYSCRAGLCSTCMARCLRGEVKMSNNDVLLESELNQGLVLTCVGYAATDIDLAF